MRSDISVNSNYRIIFPTVEEKLDQNEEFLYLQNGGYKKKIRFHDYDEVYKIEGLYEKIFYNELKCQSHLVLTEMLKEEVDKANENMSDLRVFDFGAGNGIIAEELRKKGVEHIVGVDIIPEAKDAAYRDRPEVYDDYYVLDFSDISGDVESTFRNYKFNTLVTVAALAFDDIPPDAFINAFNMIADGGWLSFNIRDKYLTEQDESGYNDVLEWMKNEHIDLKNTRKYRHRYSMNGEGLFYNAIVGKKVRDIHKSEFEKILSNETESAK